MSELAKIWGSITSKCKELNTPLFNQKGDVAKLVQQYDTADVTKEQMEEKKKGLVDILTTAATKALNRRIS